MLRLKWNSTATTTVAYLGWGHRGHVPPPYSGQVKEKTVVDLQKNIQNLKNFRLRRLLAFNFYNFYFLIVSFLYKITFLGDNQGKTYESLLMA